MPAATTATTAAAHPAIQILPALADYKHWLPLLLPGALNVLGAIAIFCVGFWLSGQADRWINLALRRSHRVDAMLQGFFGNLVRYFVLTITGLTVLSQFGVQTASLVTVIGAASLAIGLALQGTLSNLAAGVMLLIFRPFRIGHHVQVGGNDGTVRNLTLFWTEIVTDANVQIIIPNSGVWGQALKNFSVYPGPPTVLSVRFNVADKVHILDSGEQVKRIVTRLPEVAQTPAPAVLFTHSSIDNGLQILVKFTPTDGGADPDQVCSAVIEAVQRAMQLEPA